MKKIVSVLCVILLLVSSVTGCAVSDKDTKYNPRYCLKDVVSVVTDHADNFHFTEVVDKNVKCKKLSEIDENEIKKVEKSLYEYLVKEYNLDWKFKSTEIVVLNFSEVSPKYEYYAAIADPKYEKIYINGEMIKSLDQLTYRVSHELIHCLRYYNIGTLEYVYIDTKGNQFGYQLGESYTDIITSKFLETLGEQTPLDYFLKESSYCYTTVALQIIEKSIPDGDKLYLENNMDKFYENLKKLTERHIEDGNDYALKFLYQADLVIMATKAIASNISTQDYVNTANLLIYSIYGNYEIALSISDSLNEKGEREVIKILEHLFEVEGTSQEMELVVNDLKICLE